jgi:hypothetical protein
MFQNTACPFTVCAVSRTPYTACPITVCAHCMCCKQDSLHCLSLHCMCCKQDSLHCLSLHCMCCKQDSLHCLSLHCMCCKQDSLHCLSLHCMCCKQDSLHPLQFHHVFCFSTHTNWRSWWGRVFIDHRAIDWQTDCTSCKSLSISCLKLLWVQFPPFCLAWWAVLQAVIGTVDGWYLVN